MFLFPHSFSKETSCFSQESSGSKCESDCVPVPLHSLYQDGSGRQCLLIERVVKSDAGWFTLSAINVAGMSTCNARLDVTGEPWTGEISLPVATLVQRLGRPLCDRLAVEDEDLRIV